MPHQDCQIDITVQGVPLTRTMEVTRSYPDNLCLSFVGIQVWRRDFHRRCECLLCHWCEVRGFVLKKWSESRIASLVRLRVNPQALRQWENFVTGQKWSETRGGPLIEVVRNRGYTVYIISESLFPEIISRVTQQFSSLVLTYRCILPEVQSGAVTVNIIIQ